MFKSGFYVVFLYFGVAEEYVVSSPWNVVLLVLVSLVVVYPFSLQLIVLQALLKMFDSHTV